MKFESSRNYSTAEDDSSSAHSAAPLEGSISKDCEKKGEGSRNALEQRIGNHVALQHHPATLPNCSTHRYPLPGVWDRTPVPAGVATTSDLVGPKGVHVRDVRSIQLHSLRQHLFWTPLAQLGRPAKWFPGKRGCTHVQFTQFSPTYQLLGPRTANTSNTKGMCGTV